MEDYIEISVTVENGCPYKITAVTAGEHSSVYVFDSDIGEEVLTFPDIEKFGNFLDSLEEAYCIFHGEVYDD